LFAEHTMPYLDKYKVDVPEGVSGPWAVARYTVSEADASFGRLRMVVTGCARHVPAGEYTKLTCNGGTPVMSDTPDEIRDHLDVIRRARGRVLIHGLGLGVVLRACALKAEVEHVLVIDKSPDVIALVAPHYEAMFGDKVEIREGDALTWKPEKGAFWDVVWHDIWPNICLDSLPSMHRLHRRFGRRCHWQGSWSREELELRQSREKRYERRYGRRW
jgi:hypothetical protein